MAGLQQQLAAARQLADARGAELAAVREGLEEALADLMGGLVGGPAAAGAGEGQQEQQGQQQQAGVVLQGYSDATQPELSGPVSPEQVSRLLAEAVAASNSAGAGSDEVFGQLAAAAGAMEEEAWAGLVSELQLRQQRVEVSEC
jgi:hypothetical protein